MSFVPSFFDFLIAHLKKDERNRMLMSLAVTTAPEHWLSLEAAALLDINRALFGLDEPLDDRPNVPRWLIAAERKKVDLWIEDLNGNSEPISVEFKVIHNNKDFYHKIWEIRRDLEKIVPNTEANESMERWGIVLLVFHRFYNNQRGGYSRNNSIDTCEDMLRLFEEGIEDGCEWYNDAQKLEVESQPVKVCDMSTANFIDPTIGDSAIYISLVKRKD